MTVAADKQYNTHTFMNFCGCYINLKKETEK